MRQPLLAAVTLRARVPSRDSHEVPCLTVRPPATHTITCAQVSHGNTARHALEYGDKLLAKMCGLIAADEARHEHAYQRIIDGVFERDPDGAVLAWADMMRKQIIMPAHLMRDGQHDVTNPGRNLFAVRDVRRRAAPCGAEKAPPGTVCSCCAALVRLSPDESQDFAAVADKTGTYTAFDYADIVEHLNNRWTIAERHVSVAPRLRRHVRRAEVLGPHPLRPPCDRSRAVRSSRAARRRRRRSTCSSCPHACASSPRRRRVRPP